MLILWRDRFYYKLRKKEINNSIRGLRKIKITAILQGISKECWESNIQYEVIIESYDILLLQAAGLRKNVLLMYHKTSKVNLEQLKCFKQYMNIYRADRGVYITLGNFQGDYKIDRNIKLVNGVDFVRAQIGFFRRAYQVFSKNQISFYKFLPE